MSFSEPSPHELSPRPTRIRYIVIAVSTLMSILLYLDRFCVGFAVDYIREDIHLTQTDVAWFLAAFFWSYALAQVPSGWLSDRYGPRLMLVIYILSWSIFTALIGAVHSFALLLVARLGIGLSQAGAYPSCGTLLKRWVPLSNRATASSVVAFGGRVGGALAPLVTAAFLVACVPANAPVRLSDGDLLAPADIFTGLAKSATATEPTPQHRVWTVLGEDDQRFVQRLAEELSPKPATASEGTLPADGSRPPSKSGDDVSRGEEGEPKMLSPADRERLLSVLNVVIALPDLYAPDAFASVKLNGEVTRLLERRENSTLSEYEQERANRLLLEAAFPSGIRKLYVLGWRPVMYYYGAAGIVVAAVFWFYFRDSPAQHPGVNPAERELIEGEAPPASADPTGTAPREPFPFVPILTDRSLWCSSISQIGTNIGWLFLTTWLSRYLLEVHHVPALTRGMMVSLPTTAGMVGLLIGGPLTDRLTKRMGLRWGRRLPMLATRFIAMSGYVAALLLSTLPSDPTAISPWAFVAAFSVVAIGTDMGIAATWAFVQDVGGKNVGAILGWGNMWGNLGAAVAPLFYNAILGEQPGASDWNHLFLFCSAAFVVSGIASFGVDATKPVAARPIEGR